MDETSMDTVDEADNGRRRSRIWKAILACGAILGVGALVTLAAWNDTIWGGGLFGTEELKWNVHGSFDAGANWDEFRTRGEAGVMKFDLGYLSDPDDAANLNLMPGDSVHALVGLRETQNQVGATVTVMAPTTDSTNTLGQLLTVRIVDLGTANPGTYSGTGGTQIASYTLSAGQAATAVTLAAGGQRWLGFTVTMPAGVNPTGRAKSVDADWEMVATTLE